jgi:hypothetical protein
MQGFEIPIYFKVLTKTFPTIGFGRRPEASGQKGKTSVKKLELFDPL